MSKVRINDLARELEVKSNSILDALTAVGVTAKKTHSSSIEVDEAEKVRAYLTKGRPTAAKSAAKAEPKFDLSGVSKPGDALKAILARKAAESGASAPKSAAKAVVAPAKAAAKPAEKTAEPTAPAKKTVMPQPRQPSSAVVTPPAAPPAIASRPLKTTVVVARPPAAAPAAAKSAAPPPPPVEETPAEPMAAAPAPAPRRVIMPQTGPRPTYTAPPGSEGAAGGPGGVQRGRPIFERPRPGAPGARPGMGGPATGPGARRPMHPTRSFPTGGPCRRSRSSGLPSRVAQVDVLASAHVPAARVALEVPAQAA